MRETAILTADDAAEFYAEDQLLAQLPRDRDAYKIYTQVRIDTANKQIEIDHVVVRRADDKVIGIGETKSALGESKAAINQIETDLEDLSTGIEGIDAVKRAPRGTNDLEAGDFPDDINEIDQLSVVGPRDENGEYTTANLGYVRRPDGNNINVKGIEIQAETELRLL